MAGRPRTRERRAEAGEEVGSLWRHDPSLSSRPPFEVGNFVGLRHGAHSPRRVHPLAGEYAAGLLALAEHEPHRLGYLAEPQYRAAVWAWAKAEARVQLVDEWLLDRGGDLGDDGEVRPAARLLNRLESRAETLRARLGLDPLARARLGRDVAAGSLDLARLMAQLDDDADGPDAA